MATNAKARLSALERISASDPFEALADEELTALRDIALAQFDGRHDDAEAIFAAQTPDAQARIIAAARHMKGAPP